MLAGDLIARTPILGEEHVRSEVLITMQRGDGADEFWPGDGAGAAGGDRVKGENLFHTATRSPSCYALALHHLGALRMVSKLFPAGFA